MLLHDAMPGLTLPVCSEGVLRDPAAQLSVGSHWGPWAVADSLNLNSNSKSKYMTASRTLGGSRATAAAPKPTVGPVEGIDLKFSNEN